MAGIFWLASYPKSGNTWLRVALASLLAGGRPVDINAMPLVSVLANGRARFDKALGIESADLTAEQETNLRPRAYEIWAAEARLPLYCKTHDAYRKTPAAEPLFPTAATLGAIYVVRDPRAVAVSLAHHLGKSVNAAIAQMADPAAASSDSGARLSRQLSELLGRWGDHVESWLGAPFPVHLLRYDDMHADPHGALAAVAAFLGLSCDGECIAGAVEAAAFSGLQAQEKTSGFIEKPPHATAFFREGSIDGWRQALTSQQAERIVAVHGPVMRRLGYDTALMPLREPPARKASSSR